MAESTALGEWQSWFSSWQLTLEANGRRPKTIGFYERELLRFGERVGKPPLEVTRPDIREWVRAQIAEGRAPHTVNGRLIVCKSFFSWLADEGEISISPATGVSSPRHRGPDPAVMTDEEFAALLAQATGRGPFERRNTAILHVLESSGCRAGELISMTDQGTNLKERYLTVESKGGGWRAVPISAKAAEAVDRYRRTRSQLRGGNGKLWYGKQGSLTQGGLENVLAMLGRKAGVDVHAHRFRHRFAHRWLDAGGSEAGLQSAAGWSSVVMPRRYGRAMATERMLNEHSRLFGQG